MNRLQTELYRLYIPNASQPECLDPAGAEPNLVDAAGQVRAMVVEVAQQAGWDAVAALWHSVQDDFDLPAPAVAVSGIDSFQVWFSLAEPVAVAQAFDFLALIRLRYLGAVAPRYIRLRPEVDASGLPTTRHARVVPALQADTGRWSAFVAPGLAGMFAAEPWLDLAPSPDAQAMLLSRIESIKPAAFQLALARLRPPTAPTSPAAQNVAPPAQLTDSEPKRFLLAVMNDPTAELGSRIEAAKALLPYCQ
jgi:hypothetical protein